MQATQNIKMTQWAFYSRIGSYFIWSRIESGVTFYNCTREALPPNQGAGGYFNLNSMLKLKGVC